MRSPLYLVILLTCASLAPSRTADADADRAAEATAKAYYERGQQLFALQQFDGALEQFKLAFDAKLLPELLFNIGQCHRNLGDYDAAIFAYKRYLQLVPRAPNRINVEKLIAQLEEKRAGLEAFRRGLRDSSAEELPQLVLREPVFITPPPGPRPFYKKWWFWAGAAAVGAAGGITLYAVTRPPDTDLGHLEFRR